MESLKTAALWYHHHHHHNRGGDDDSRGTQKDSRHESLSAKYFPSAMLSTSNTILNALEFQPSFSDENQMTNGKF
jgi:hypothetical protein